MRGLFNTATSYDPESKPAASLTNLYVITPGLVKLSLVYQAKIRRRFPIVPSSDRPSPSSGYSSSSHIRILTQ